MTGPRASEQMGASPSSVLTGTPSPLAAQKLNCRGTESCYLLKYVQKRPRAGVGVNPWSISQSLVYQKVFCAAKRTDHLLVKPSDAFTNRLHHYLSQGHAVAANIASDWTRVHSMGFGSVDDSFRDCFNFLDERISEIVRFIHLQSVHAQEMLIRCPVWPCDDVRRRAREASRVGYLGELIQRYEVTPSLC